jgi:hypothetical protein
MRLEVSQQTITCFSMEMGMFIIIQTQDFSYIMDSYQQLRGYDLLVMGRCI